MYFTTIKEEKKTAGSPSPLHRVSEEEEETRICLEYLLWRQELRTRQEQALEYPVVGKGQSSGLELHNCNSTRGSGERGGRRAPPASMGREVGTASQTSGNAFSVIIIVLYRVQVIDPKRDSKPGKSESWRKERKRPSSKEEKSDQELVRCGAEVSI